MKVTEKIFADPSFNIEEEILKLKKEKNAIILAHFYQDSEIQDIADFVGDSLDLSRKAKDADADLIVFCGVKFMAETAKILSPNTKVVLPDMDAGCSLELSAPIDKFKAYREKLNKEVGEHVALTYINCSADVKAASDIIVTSSCAEQIVEQIPKDKPILFSPDKYLGGWLSRKTGRDMIMWEGTCIVHEQFNEKELVKLKTRNPDAVVIAHPECPKPLLDHSEYIGSTIKLIQYVEKHGGKGKQFIVLTEPGILHEMQKRSPESELITVGGTMEGCTSCNNCPFMKMNTLEKLYLCLANETPELTMTPELIEAAAKPLNKMLEMTS